MAVPAETKVPNLSGIYTLNRQLSDSPQAVLKQQGVGWMLRQAIAHSDVTMTLTFYIKGDKVHLDQLQKSTASENFEDRVLDWEWADKQSWIWGSVRGRSRIANLSEIDDQWLRDGWDLGGEDGEIIESYIESATDTWQARQVWGFAVVDGVRKHVRRVLAQKPGSQTEKFRQVYDWKGPLQS